MWVQCWQFDAKDIDREDRNILLREERQRLIMNLFNPQRLPFEE